MLRLKVVGDKLNFYGLVSTPHIQPSDFQTTVEQCHIDPRRQIPSGLYQELIPQHQNV